MIITVLKGFKFHEWYSVIGILVLAVFAPLSENKTGLLLLLCTAALFWVFIASGWRQVAENKE